MAGELSSIISTFDHDTEATRIQKYYGVLAHAADHTFSLRSSQGTAVCGLVDRKEFYLELEGRVGRDARLPTLAVGHGSRDS